jgi:hypothetical protein
MPGEIIPESRATSVGIGKTPSGIEVALVLRHVVGHINP